MPIRVATSTLQFKDEDGKPVEDASFTIRNRLSHEGQVEYFDMLAQVEIDPESGKTETVGQRILLSKVADILLRDSLLSWEGMLDLHGQPIPIHLARTADSFYVAQVVRAIQERNAGGASGADASPKGGAPSASSSRGGRKAA